MGLGLEVGILADLKEVNAEGFAYFKRQFGILNQVLSDAGLGRMSNLKSLTGSSPAPCTGTAGSTIFGVSEPIWLSAGPFHRQVIRKPPTIRSSSAITGMAS